MQFALCSSDPLCSARWGLSAGDPEFAEARFREMMDAWQARERVAFSDDDDVAGDAVWLVMMRGAAVCAANEEWVLGHGCVCAAGKHCAIDCTQVVIADMWSLAVAVGVFGLVGLFLVVWLTQQDRELARKLEERFGVVAAQFYMIQAELYIVEASAAAATTAPPTAPIQTAYAPHI